MRIRWPHVVLLTSAAGIGLASASSLPVGAALPDPPYSKFGVDPAFSGKPAQVDFRGNAAAYRFRTVIREGAREGPNFADHYTLVTWGCGAGCQSHAIIDARTGAVHMLPITTSYGVGVRRDSRLLIADPAERCLDPESAGSTNSIWYVWTGQKLQKVGSRRIVAPCDD